MEGSMQECNNDKGGKTMEVGMDFGGHLIMIRSTSSKAQGMTSITSSSQDSSKGVSSSECSS